MRCGNMKFITIMVIVVAASVTVQSKSRETFIVNGLNASASIQFYAYLEIIKENEYGGGPTIYFGGGTVISTSFILTCAQNVVGFDSWRVGLGALSISNMQWFLSTTAFIHHGYDNKTLSHNVALLRLNQHITMGTGITPIALPPATSTEPTSVVNLYGFGWGATNHQPAVLQYGNFLPLPQEMCEDMYPHLAQTGQTENHFCADRSMGNVCDGDQGSPAIWGSWVIGIQSFYRYANCRDPKAQPVGFIRVPRYVTWINNVTSTQALL